MPDSIDRYMPITAAASADLGATRTARKRFVPSSYVPALLDGAEQDIAGLRDEISRLQRIATASRQTNRQVALALSECRVRSSVARDIAIQARLLASGNPL